MIVEDEYGFIVDYFSVGLCLMDRLFIDILKRKIDDMDIVFGFLLCNVFCFNDGNIWICGLNDENMILYDL